MKPWHEQQPRRLYKELEAMNDRHPCMQLVPAGADLWWQGFVEVRGTRHFVHLLYPWNYPLRPPWVWETEPFKDAIVEYRQTGHQMLGGDLCLYTHDHGEHAWKSTYTAADALDRYAAFRETVEDGALVRPAGAILPWQAQVWISPALAQLMTLPGSWGTLLARSTPDDRIWVVEKVEVHGKELPLADNLAHWRSRGLGPQQHRGVWWRVEDENAPWAKLAATWEAVNELAKASLPQAASIELQGAPLVLLSRDRQGHAQDILALRRPLPGLPQWMACQARIARLEQAIFARVEPVLGNIRALHDMRVVMIGLGSLGSHVALSLAKAGVGSFLLYDPQCLEPENVCRHIGDLADIGMPKAEIVRQAIHRRHPGARVRAYSASPIGDGLFEGQEPFQALRDALQSRTTLIVVTVAEAYVERTINRLAVQAGVPVVYGSVLGDAEHGRVFRVIPEKTACYQCVCTSQEREPGTYRWFAGTEGSELPGRGAYQQPGLPGIGIDVEQIALMTARLALQTLGRMVPEGIGYPDDNEDHLLWTNRGGWEFDRPLQVHVERYSRVDDCEVCGTGAEHRPLDDEETERLTSLLREMKRPERMAPDVPGMGD